MPLILLGVTAIGVVLVPLITSEARAFTNEAPTLIEDIAEDWRTSDNQFLGELATVTSRNSSSGLRIRRRRRVILPLALLLALVPDCLVL